MNQKKLCRDSILSILRRKRLKPANQKSGTASGVLLRRLRLSSLTLYTEQELSDALNAMLADGTLLLIARVWVHTPHTLRSIHRLAHTEHVPALPSGISLSSNEWVLTPRGEPMSPPYQGSCIVMHDLKLYIVADGLPRKVARFGDAKPHPEAMHTLKKTLR